ncbi:MAG: sigma-70 family RNA polymerase sigma factor [Planctomycetota bacterium]
MADLVDRPEANADAFAADFRRRLWQFARRRVPADADADDVVQETLTRLWQRRASVAPAAVRGWLFRVARSAIADLHRARGRAPATLDLGADDELAESPAGRDPEAPRELAACLLPLLDELPEPDRAVLRRVELEGVSQTELARELSLSASGAKSRVQRARDRLRRAVLDCCRIELDRRGLPLDDYECRRAPTPDRCMPDCGTPDCCDPGRRPVS